MADDDDRIDQIDRTPDDEAGIHRRERLLDDEVHRLQHESELVEEHIRDARRDWERKRADPAVPGAIPHGEIPPRGRPQPPEDEPEETPETSVAGDWRGEAQDAAEAGQ